MKIKELLKPKYLFTIFTILICVMIIDVFRIGVANNGDFGRVMYTVGINDYNIPQDTKYFKFIHNEYNMDKENNLILKKINGEKVELYYFTTQFFFIFIAKIFSMFISVNHFYLIILANIYIVFFGIAMYIIFSCVKCKSKVLTCIIDFLIMIIATNTENIAYFNSFYGEPVSYISLLFIIGCSLKCIKQKSFESKYYVLLLISMAFFVGAKQQNTILVVPLIIFIIFLFFKYVKSLKYRAFTIISAILIGIISFYSFATITEDISACTAYHSVFVGVLEVTDDKEAAMEYFDLDKDLLVLQGYDYWQADNVLKEIKGDNWQEYKKNQIDNKLNRTKVIKYYLGHFDELIKGWIYTLENSFANGKDFFEYLPPKLLNKGYKFKDFIVWNKIKRILFYNIIPIYASVIIFYLLIFIDVCRRIFKYFKDKNDYNLVFAILILIMMSISGIQFAITYISNGHADIDKQIYLYNVITDILIAIYIYFCCKVGYNYFNKLKAKIKTREIIGG